MLLYVNLSGSMSKAFIYFLSLLLPFKEFQNLITVIAKNLLIFSWNLLMGNFYPFVLLPIAL